MEEAVVVCRRLSADALAGKHRGATLISRVRALTREARLCDPVLADYRLDDVGLRRSGGDGGLEVRLYFVR